MSLIVPLYRALVIPRAKYALGTLTLKTEDYKKIEVFEMHCLRAIRDVTMLNTKPTNPKKLMG